MPITRRTLLGAAACSAAALALPARSRILGACGDLRIGVVGLRSRGRSHISGLHRLPGVRVVALCDVDKTFLDRERAAFQKRGETVAIYRDIRNLLDATDVDAISIATPNHWHALMAIWACQAGKDVYLEKPVSHNPWEGGRIVAAARKYSRIVATGTQIRSSAGIREAVAWLQEGNLGPIQRVRGLCYKRRKSIGRVEGNGVVPDSVDYDLWCGPSPLEPLRRIDLHYDWHWQWATGNGDLGNQGIHQMDVGRWLLGEDRLPPAVYSVGGRVGYEDDGETGNTQVIVCAYQKAPLIFEVRGLPSKKGADAMDQYKGASIGVVAECENGWMTIDSYSRARAFDRDGGPVKEFDGDGDHFANFVAAVRSRKHRDLRADIREGHLSSALCHLGNISYRLGSTVPLARLRRHLDARPHLAEPLARMADHLGRNGLDPEETGMVMGPVLTVDPADGTVLDNRAARALLRRRDRAPFTVPDSP